MQCSTSDRHKGGNYHRSVTLHERMLPKAEKVSYRALLSMDLSRFLMKMFPTPLFLSEGSRWDHMMRTGRPLITSKFMVSRARSAVGRNTAAGVRLIWHIYIHLHASDLVDVNFIVSVKDLENTWNTYYTSPQNRYIKRLLKENAQ